MYRMKKSGFTLLFLPLLFYNFPSQDIEKGGKIFQFVASSHLGITFNNRLRPVLKSKKNLFDFDILLNVAGVGVADLNSDGLAEILLASNKGSNTLYHNRGDLPFTDISESSVRWRKRTDFV